MRCARAACRLTMATVGRRLLASQVTVLTLMRSPRDYHGATLHERTNACLRSHSRIKQVIAIAFRQTRTRYFENVRRSGRIRTDRPPTAICFLSECSCRSYHAHTNLSPRGEQPLSDRTTRNIDVTFYHTCGNISNSIVADI